MLNRNTWQGASNVAALIAITGGIMAAVLLGLAAQWLGLLAK